jgi:hypothetical protein
LLSGLPRLNGRWPVLTEEIKKLFANAKALYFFLDIWDNSLKF